MKCASPSCPSLAPLAALGLLAPGAFPEGAACGPGESWSARPTTAALVSPGMGWVLHHYDNSLERCGSKLAPSDPLDDFPGLSTVYLRGGIAAVLVDPGLDVRTLPVGAPGEARAVARESSFRVPASVKPGTYDLLVSVGSAIGTPAIALPHEGDDGQRRYRLASIRVLPPLDR